MPTETQPIVVILGATATGKTAVALAVAEELEGEIVNADALQVYRGFDLGTAKPTQEEQARVPHHLIDILDPHERFSAGEFARRARGAIEDIRSRHKLPVVVGGSGLYLRALLEGISPIPKADPEIRNRLRRRLEKEGLDVLAAELERRDPRTARRLQGDDSQRILRALEVVESTGVPLSEWIIRQPFGDQRLPALRIGLTVPRAILYDRIAIRVDRMLEMGWLEEVEGLLGEGLSSDLPAFQAIGYRQLVRVLRDQVTLDDAVEDILRQTRRFAKRQETWFRKAAAKAAPAGDDEKRSADIVSADIVSANIVWFDASDPRETIPRVLAYAEQGCGRFHG